MSSSNNIIDQIKDLVVPGRVKIRMLEEALAQERARFNHLEQTLPQSLNYLREGMIDGQARIAVMEHRLPISLHFLQEKYEMQKARATSLEMLFTEQLENLADSQNAARQELANQLRTDLTSLHGQVLEQVKHVRAMEAGLSGTFKSIEGEFGSVRTELRDNLHSVRTNLGSLQGHLNSLQDQFEDRVRQLVELQYEIKFERNRIDYALGAQEGILFEREAFHRARATPEYQAVYAVENPLVSICIATANRPDLLIGRCISSILRQTYQNFEIIVVGDHCIDSTPERMAELNDPRITFHNLAQRGPYPPPGRDRWCVAGTHPYNHALMLSKGEFITHLDDDDEFHPHRLEMLVRTIQATKADICFHPYWYEKEDGCWHVLGNGNFESGQIGTDTIFYHRYLARFPTDVFAYRLAEPGDWNRLRKIAMLRPHKHFVSLPLARHYYGRNHQPFVAQEGETFLE